jgi:hypothetical protein
VDSSGTTPRGARTQAGIRRVNKAIGHPGPAQRLVLLFHTLEAGTCLSGHSTRTKSLSLYTSRLLSPLQSSCRDCCLSHLTPSTLPSLSPPAICTLDHAPRRVWLVALTTPLPAIRRPIYDDTTALIHTHTHYRLSSKQLHITTTKWLVP